MCPFDVITREIQRVSERVVHVGLRGKVYDGFGFETLEEGAHHISIAHVPFHETDPLGWDVFHRCTIVQLVENDDVMFAVHSTDKV